MPIFVNSAKKYVDPVILFQLFCAAAKAASGQ